MGILPDHKLLTLGKTLIEPFNPKYIQPASTDVHIDCYIYKAIGGRWGAGSVGPHKDSKELFEWMEIAQGESYLMPPGDFILASTFERVTVPANMVARFEGKSSLARLGLLTHVTAGFIDPGFCGYITLELKNLLPTCFEISPGMKIGQICFEEIEGTARWPYGDSINGSHYNNAERGPTLSRSHQNFEVINVY